MQVITAKREPGVMNRPEDTKPASKSPSKSEAKNEEVQRSEQMSLDYIDSALVNDPQQVPADANHLSNKPWECQNAMGPPT
jgi:hypothetical protein